MDVGELRFGNDLGGRGLLVLRERLGVVDAHQHRSSRDRLPPLHGNLTDTAIDARRNVKPGGVHLSLDQQRLRPHEVPERQATDDSNHQRDDHGRKAAGCGGSLVR
jgi:hypothetical protein